MSMIVNSILKTEGLSKTFKVGFWGRSVTAVHGLDLDVHKGEVFGFLGPNGAGKTTTIKMLMGLIYPTSGQAWLFGMVPKAALQPQKIFDRVRSWA